MLINQSIGDDPIRKVHWPGTMYPELNKCTVLLSLLVIFILSEANRFTLPSSTHIDVALVRLHIPDVPFSYLPHVIFEHDSTAQLLSSHHVKINISQLAPQGKFIRSGNVTTFIRSGYGYTFAYEKTSRHLISAWGPSLQLHPVDHALFPGVMINSATYKAPTFLDEEQSVPKDLVSHGLQRALQSHKRHGRECLAIKSLSFDVIMSHSFGKMYGNDGDVAKQIMAAMFHRISELFIHSVCVGIQSNYKTYFGKEEFYSEFFMDEQSVMECASNKSCVVSDEILNSIHRPGFPAYRAGALFTGYSIPHSTLGGAAIRSSPCFSRKLWTIGSSDVVLAHEIGHILGARHDRSGIMMPIVDHHQPLELSIASQAQIIQFMQRSSTAWCLRFQYYHKLHSKVNLSDQFPRKPLFTQGFARNSIVTIFQEYSIVCHRKDCLPTRGKYNDKDVFYTIRPIEQCNYSKHATKMEPEHNISNGKNNGNSQHVRRIPLSFSRNYRPHAVAFASPGNGNSTLMLIATEKRFRLGQWGDYFSNIRYFVGYGFDDSSGSPPVLRGSNHIPIHIPQYYRKRIGSERVNWPLSINRVAMAAGQIRSPRSTDLFILIQFIRSNKLQLIYIIGFDLDQHGQVNGGWSKQRRITSPVQGYYGPRFSQMSISIADVNGNGKPDLLMSVYGYNLLPYESTITHYSGVIIGLDIDEDGKFTGGWTDVFVPKNVHELTTFGYAQKCTGLMVSRSWKEIQNVTDAKSFKTYHFINTEVSQNRSLLNALLPTAINVPDGFELTKSCKQCLSSEDTLYQRCVHTFENCGKDVDEVLVTNAFKSTNNTKPMEKMVPSRFLSMPVNDSVIMKKGESTLFCTGLIDIIQTAFASSDFSEFCSYLERDWLISRGAEYEIKHVLHSPNQRDWNDFEMKTLYSDPSGIGGKHNKPIVAQFKISGKKEDLTRTVQNIVRKLRRKDEFDSSTTGHLHLNYYYEGRSWYIQIHKWQSIYTEEL